MAEVQNPALDALEQSEENQNGVVQEESDLKGMENDQYGKSEKVLEQSAERATEAAEEPPMKRDINGTIVDQDRIQICNIPNFFGYKQFKKFLEKNLENVNVRKIRHMRDTAYVSFDTSADAEKAVQVLNGIELKKCKLSARLAPSEKRKGGAPGNERPREEKEVPLKTSARESVTPLADIPYEKQLEIKTKECYRIARNLAQQAIQAKVPGAKQWKPEGMINRIKAAPMTTGYRNKCEFTVGLNLQGEVCVGFVGGRFSKNQHYTLPVHDCDNMSVHTKRIVSDFEEFVKESGLAPFDEFARVGTWKMLTVREFGGDAMMIVTVFPFKDDHEKFEEVKRLLTERYITGETFTTRKIRVTSLYISVMEHASDNPNYTLVAGAPYIYETVMDCRFRVSPSAFFQTNSHAAAVLYTTIGEQCGFIGEDSTGQSLITSTINDESQGGNTVAPSGTSSTTGDVVHSDEHNPMEIPEEDDSGPTEPKKRKTDGDMDDPGTVLLDICCGTGTIGLCLLKEFRKRNKVACIGIEMIESAVEDAKQNAQDNGMSDNRCQYIAGKAEDVFRSLKYNLAPGFSLDESKVVGVLDPPRAGMHERVIVGCRNLSSMKRLVFVSCDPSAATKNIVDLCRPTSNKFEGVPFEVESIIPVDMFPQTRLVEWVVTMTRD